MILLFFVPRFALSLYQVMNMDNEFANAKFLTFVEVFETVTMALLLYIFRPRKEWPEFFWLGIGDAANDRAAGDRGRADAVQDRLRRMVPMLTAIVDTKLVVGKSVR